MSSLSGGFSSAIGGGGRPIDRPQLWWDAGHARTRVRLPKHGQAPEQREVRSMPSIVARTTVQDCAAWKRSLDQGAAARQAAEAKRQLILRSPDAANEVVVMTGGLEQ